MGLLKTLLGSESAESTSFNEQEAFAAVMVTIASSDGHVSKRELDHFFAVICRMQMFSGQTVNQYNLMIQKINTLLANTDQAFVLEKAAEGLSPEMRETAFAVAVDTAFADGMIDNDEMIALEDTKRFMGISDSTASQIIEVIKIKNRG